MQEPKPRQQLYRAIRGGYRKGWGKAFLVTAIAMLLNAIVLNAVMMAKNGHIKEGSLRHAADVNVLLSVTADFNLMFLFVSVAVCSLLTVTTLNSIYAARVPQFRVLRLSGWSLSQIGRFQLSEGLRLGVISGGVAALAYVPAFKIYELVLRTAGMAPRDVNLRIGLEPLLISIAVTTGLILCQAWLKARTAYPIEEVQGLRTKRRKPVFKAICAVLLLVSGVPVFVRSLGAVADDARMMLAMLWALVLTLVFGVDALRILYNVMDRNIRRTGMHPHFGLAIARLRASMATRVNPVIPVTVVLAFAIPLSGIMATGRAASEANLYSSMNVSSVAISSSDMGNSNILANVPTGEESLFVGTLADVYYSADPYAANQPLISVTNVGKLPKFFSNFEVTGGELDAVSGFQVAAPDSLYRVGDSISIRNEAGKQFILTVVATAKLPILLGDSIIVSDDLSGWPAPQFWATRIYSQLASAQLAGLLPGWETYSLDEWAEQGVHDMVKEQRSALVIVFFAPLLLAAFVTGVAMNARSTVVAKHENVLQGVGATRKDILKTAVREAGIACFSSFLLLLVAFGINSLAIWPTAEEAGVPVVFDYQVDALVLVLTYVVLGALFILSGTKFNKGNLRGRLEI